MNTRCLATWMGLRAGALGLTLMVIACLPAPAQEFPAQSVNRGDTIAEVVAKLGRPRGSMKSGASLTYSYSRGMVNFVDGQVVSAFVMTPELAEQRNAEQERAVESNRQQAEQQRQRLLAASQAELRKQKEDTAFGKRPAAERLAYWEDFQRRYPFADVGAELAPARAAVAEEADRSAQADELKTLSARIAAIQVRRGELDADYAASLANWKRNEINAERAKLLAELLELGDRLRQLAEPQDKADGVSTNAAVTTTVGP